MILLDSDHVSALQIPGSERRARLLIRLNAVAGELIATSIVTVEENMCGWLASIAKEKQVRRQAKP